jgi:hypothetical protein
LYIANKNIMGILDKDFEKAIASMEAAELRGKMGHKKANKLIQTLNNAAHNRNHCGFD